MAGTGQRIVVWQAQPGPQTTLIQCPTLDIFYGGARGGGKTYGGLGKWLKHARRYGVFAKGIVFRRTMPELEEFQLRCRDVLSKLGWTYHVQARTWTAPDGASLKLRFLEHDRDADKYQGHEYTFMLVEEMGSFPNPEPIDQLRACLRSSVGVQPEFLATGNPGGVGHSWIKKRYVDPAQPGTVFYDESARCHRVFIPARLEDNRLLLKSNPGYIDQLYSATVNRPWLRKNWLEGDWDAIPAETPFPHVQYHCGNGEPTEHAPAVPAHLRLWWCLDMAYTKAKRSDFTASGIWGSDSDWNLYELHYHEAKMNAAERLDYIFETIRLWQPRGLDTLHIEAHRDFIDHTLPEQMEIRKFDFGVEELKTFGVAKADRITDNIQPAIPRMYFQPGSKLAQRVLAWNGINGEPDDGPDMLGYIVRESNRAQKLPPPAPVYNEEQASRIAARERLFARRESPFEVVR